MPVAALAEGTLTFLLTDLVGSTRAWESAPRLMRDAMASHDRIVAAAVKRHQGAVVETGREGDSVLAVFRRAGEAAACALDLQREIEGEQWPARIVMQMRIALHTGEAELRDGHYHGQPLNRCARLLATCNGGQVLASRATEQILVDQLPPHAALWDLGYHRLKDLMRPEYVFQLVDLDRPKEFPRIQSLRNDVTNLPVQLTEFVGRETELKQLLELQLRARLLTLTGPGGVGKTRLALQLAAELLGDYEDGVWLAELAQLSSAVIVPREVAGSLDLTEQPGRPVLDTLVDHCRDRRLLLLLDNCEHAVEAVAQMVERLLTSCEHVSVIATSLERLKVPGEQVWLVPPLSRTEAVRLFAESAVRNAPSFRITEANSDAVAVICERLDQIPLAVELAAARVPMLTVAEIVTRLETRFTLLTRGRRTASPRQRTLKAVVDWSHELLNGPERILFRRLSVFAGRFTLEAAEAVCADESLPRDQVLDLVSQLVDKSLVLAGDGHYRLLETLRDYGRARLKQVGEEEAMRRKLANQLIDMAEARESGQLASWLDRLNEVHDDVRSMISWCADADPELGIRLARTVSMFWQMRGHLAEPRQFVETLLERVPAAAPMRLAALDLAGMFAYLQGDFDSADRAFKEVLLKARAIGDQAMFLTALNRYGLMEVARGDPQSAEKALEEALTLAQELVNQKEEADSLHLLGLLAGTRGDLASSRSLLKRSIDLRTNMGRRDEASVSLAFLAFAILLGGDRELSRRHLHESLEIGRSLKDRRAAWSLDILACLTALDGQAERAVCIEGIGSAMHDSIGNRPSAAWRALTSPMLLVARETLGPEASDAAWQAGHRLRFEEALDYAVADERSAAAR